jgi:hypothetical protein
MQMRDVWYTTSHVMGGWDWKLKNREFAEAATELLAVEVMSKPVPELEHKPVQKQPPVTNPKKGVNPAQLTLF